MIWATEFDKVSRPLTPEEYELALKRMKDIMYDPNNQKDGDAI